jgi:hypothetical protein
LALASKIGNLLTDRLDARVFTTDELSAGENWESKLRNQLAEADAIVTILSPERGQVQLGAAWDWSCLGNAEANYSGSDQP